MGPRALAPRLTPLQGPAATRGPRRSGPDARGRGEQRHADGSEHHGRPHPDTGRSVTGLTCRLVPPRAALAPSTLWRMGCTRPARRRETMAASAPRASWRPVSSRATSPPAEPPMFEPAARAFRRAEGETDERARQDSNLRPLAPEGNDGRCRLLRCAGLGYAIARSDGASGLVAWTRPGRELPSVACLLPSFASMEASMPGS